MVGFINYLKKKSVTYIILSTVLVTQFFIMVPLSNAQEGAQMLIEPETLSLRVGDNFTITIIARNLETLYSWQVFLKFNASVVNCTETDVWIPPDNVFSGHRANPTDVIFRKDVVDGLDGMGLSCSLQGDDYVSVSEGVLFKVNFTVKAVGSTVIKIATKDDPVKTGQFYTFYSWFCDYYLEEVPFSSSYCIVVVEGSVVNLPPVVRLVVTVPEVDTSKYLVLRGHTPTEALPYTFAFKGYPVIFNASISIDPDGNITSYLWDFGDGNVTETSGPIVVHVYGSTGKYYVLLTVFDDGDPPMNSTYRFIVVVGLLLELFDWSPALYGLGVVIAVAVVVSVVRRVRNYLKFRSKFRSR
ncbi:MAG: PKD domain-containing protein [Candidatus Bathyarchaeia archaeon]